ncbi:hypothetical protein HN51_049333 [Arachis hypogaea]|uniref:C2 domain-containing protein n=1 Tax=Arachis hypogaea TaxID=3818 RepID=A0A444YFB7_ARAHY|nr:uncharacterized protein DS421_17g571250 [Arachis hypogaea]RYR00622.1 hypothetical protein Ahy_B07g088747 [Arachis hypogaea]
MESPQSVVSPLKKSVLVDNEKQKHDFSLSKDIEVNGTKDDFMGVVDVYIHEARDIHNICIYHKQDVYAKICLTSDPDNSVSTKIINGGGNNPVFNENLSLSVRTVDSAVKCEIWMLSRVRNYLEDQLLGFALVPLSEVLVNKDCKLEKEFSLSSTDLFHSPAGFVQLSLAYSGASPDVMAISSMPLKLAANEIDKDSEPCSESLVEDLDKIEFPDPKIAKEDCLMVSEYISIQCSEDAENHSSVESMQPPPPPKVDSPPSSVSTNGISSPSVAASSESSAAKEEKKTMDVKNGDSDSSSREAFAKPLVSLKIEPEPEPSMVQQDIVDMYMKSMQQFTESLAKMKLPNMDSEKGVGSSGNSGSSEQKLQASRSGNSRVFYGSRAFF